jgi:DNA-binding response OmpR family regulator
VETGATDYLTRPFDRAELAERVRALLGISNSHGDAEFTLTWGNLFLRPDAVRVTVQGKEVRVTALEFRLLHFLASHPHRVFSREQLLNAVWGHNHFVVPRIVDVYIRQLRQKLGETSEAAAAIRTLRGFGYMLEADVKTVYISLTND